MRSVVKRIISLAAVVSLFAPVAMAERWIDKGGFHPHGDRVKNVIVLVPDGCDESVQTLARWYKGANLQVDSMQGGSVKIHMANSVITGSAAAATAFAAGHKTSVRFLGIGPRTHDLLTGLEPTAAPYAPVATVLEAAKLAGKSTGLVATSRITHATPAAFASHIEDRGWDNDIMEHMVYNKLDVAFGGGARHLLPKDTPYTTSFGDVWNGKRTDGENLMEVLESRGYTFVDNRDDMSALTTGKAWGLFDDSHLDADIDRLALHPTQPSIAEMTEKAIDLLSQNHKGFFLMVEGSQVDWAGHNNDPIYMVKDFIAFDEAVRVAVKFAEKNRNTAVIAFPDHNTGGMTIGNRDYNTSYTHLTLEELIDPLMGMKISSGELVAKIDELGGMSVANIQSAVFDYWGIEVSDAVAQEIIDLTGVQEGQDDYVISPNYALARIISKHYTAIGWTSHGHNGATVPVWTYGIDVKGTIDNTDLAGIIADAMGVNLKRATKRLYVDIREITDNFKIDVTTDENGDAKTGQLEGNGYLRIGNCELPISKDYMIIKHEKREKKIRLPGVTVYASGDANVPETVYISKKAARVLKQLGQI
jgi:alkaline phosphatase